MPEAHASETVGWGIVGLGGIAGREIAPAVTTAHNSRLVGVAGRDAARAGEFAERHGARAAYGDYEALLSDPDVDVVYIATANALHADQAVAAARAGKHVLCDKPRATCGRRPDRARAGDLRCRRSPQRGAGGSDGDLVRAGPRGGRRVPRPSA